MSNAPEDCKICKWGWNHTSRDCRKLDQFIETSKAVMVENERLREENKVLSDVRDWVFKQLAVKDSELAEIREDYERLGRGHELVAKRNRDLIDQNSNLVKRIIREEGEKEALVQELKYLRMDYSDDLYGDKYGDRFNQA